MAHEEPVLRTVGRSAVYQAMLCKGSAQFAQRIPLRAHLGRIPVGKFAFIHLEAVMMLRHGNHIFCASLFKKLRPFFRVELLRFEHGNEILVAELLMGAIGFHMVFKFRRTLDVHISGVPFASERGHAVDAPVDENAEFSIPEPLRQRMGA